MSTVRCARPPQNTPPTDEPTRCHCKTKPILAFAGSPFERVLNMLASSKNVVLTCPACGSALLRDVDPDCDCVCPNCSAVRFAPSGITEPAPLPSAVAEAFGAVPVTVPFVALCNSEFVEYADNLPELLAILNAIRDDDGSEDVVIWHGTKVVMVIHADGRVSDFRN